MDYENKRVLAPMVRVGTLPFRLLSLDYGADIVYGEEVIDYRFVNCTRSVNCALGSVDFVEAGTGVVVFRTCDEERGKVVFQMGTSDPVRALRAAEIVANDIAAVDVNMGCPKPFSTAGGMGSALLSQPEKAHDILKHLRRNLNIPVTCKIRLLPSEADAVELARRLESAGISALAVHCRFKPDRPRQPARWPLLPPVVSAVHVPVIANGDVFSYPDFDRIRHATGASSAMVARAAMWNPSVFRAEGELDWEITKRAFVKKCVEWDNDWKWSKHTVREMIIHHANYEIGEGRDVNRCQSLKDLCDLYGFQDFYADTVRRQRERAKGHNEAACGCAAGEGS